MKKGKSDRQTKRICMVIVCVALDFCFCVLFTFSQGLASREALREGQFMLRFPTLHDLDENI